jgi:hypothetical protein
VNPLSALVRGAKEVARKERAFYSPLDKAISEITQKKGTGEQMLVELMKTKGVSKELKDRPAVKAALQQPKVTKEQLQKVAEENPPAQIFEKVEKGPSEARYRVEHDDLNDRYDVVDDYSNVVKSFRDYDDAEFYAGKLEGGTTKYEEYQLPGGKNYREIKLMLPNESSKQHNQLQNRIDSYEAQGAELRSKYPVISERPPETQAKIQMLRDLSDELRQQQKDLSKKAVDPSFRSTHYEEPNILAHARVSDRTGPNGEKILHVEEIQSDWHQTGRKKGYKEQFKSEMPDVTGRLMTVNEFVEKQGQKGIEWLELKNSINKNIGLPELRGEDELNVMFENGNPVMIRGALESPMSDMIESRQRGLRNIHRQAQRDFEAKQLQAVPDAPFKQNWHELVMKRLLDDAAKKGYDRVVITPAEEQLKRYPGTEKHFGEISYLHNPNGTISVIGRDKNTKLANLHEEDLPKDELAKAVGKELADRIMANEGVPYSGSSRMESGKMTIPDLDVKHGGKLLKDLYDTKLPSFLNDYGKKWGAKVGKYELPESEPLHSFDITPQMREDIVGRGQPLYQAIPAGVGAGTLATHQEEVPEQPMKRGGAVSMDAMRLAVINKQLRKHHG